MDNLDRAPLSRPAESCRRKARYQAAGRARSALLATIVAIASPPATSQQEQPERRSGQPPRQETMRPAVAPPEVLRLGKKQLAAGHPDLALHYFDQFTRMRPADPDGHFWVGMALGQAGRDREALWAYSRSLDAAMKENMDSAELRVNIGHLLMRSNHLQDALFNYRRATEIDDKLPAPHYYLGRALLLAGEPAQAFAELNRASELGFKDPAIMLYKAMVLKSLGKPDDARDELKLLVESLKSDPGKRSLMLEAQKCLSDLGEAARSGDEPAGQ